MQPLTGADGGSPLVDVAGLAAEMAGGRPPVLLDVRWRLGGPPGEGMYRAGHLPGAHFIDLDRDLSGTPGPGGRHPLPPPGHFQSAMRQAGVSDGRPVVVYDEADATAAARCWWLLRYFGHRFVRVLDGGYRAWRESGGPVVAGDQAVPGDGGFTARAGHMALLEPDSAADLARHGVLLDARAPERYRGEVEPLDPVAGHIPGAISAPTAGNLSADGRFLPATGLRARFASLGVEAAADGQAEAGQAEAGGAGGTGGARGTGGDGGTGGAGGTAGVRVGCYCGSGITAAHEVLALTVAGIPAALYAGSWSQWVTDPRRPVATGPEPG